MQAEVEQLWICIANSYLIAAHMLKQCCFLEVEKEEEKGLTGTTAHALCWHAETGDVAEAPMEIVTQTLMSGKVLVCVSPP